MFQLILLFFCFLIVSIFIKNKIIRIVYATVVSIFYSSQIISVYMTQTFINEAFLAHIRVDSVEMMFKAFLPQTIFLLVVTFFIGLAIYSFRYLYSKIKIRYIDYLSFFLCFCFIAYLSMGGGVLNQSFLLFKNIYTGQVGTDESLNLESIFKKYGLDYSQFVDRESINATKGKNVVIIILESIEQNFMDNTLFDNLTPNLNRLKDEEGWHFYSKYKDSHNSYLSFGASYIAMTGFPYSSIFGINDHFKHASNSTTMPGYGDVFKAAGYNMEALIGPPTFSDIDKFYELYGFNVKGYRKDFPSTAKFSGWGVHDKDLFELAKQEYINLSKENKPFILNILTLDVHHPSGLYDDRFPKKGRNDLETMVAANDLMINDFIDFLKQQDNYEDTVIFIFPDHLSPSISQNILKKKERNLFLLTNADVSKLAIQPEEEFISPYLPRLIIDAAEIKTNALLLGDIFKTSNTFLSNKELNYINTSMWHVFSVEKGFSIQKEKKAQLTRFIFTDPNGTEYSTLYAPDSSIFNLRINNGMLSHKAVDTTDNDLKLNIRSTDNDGFALYIGNSDDIGQYLKTNSNSLEIPQDVLKRIQISQQIKDNVPMDTIEIASWGMGTSDYIHTKIKDIAIKGSRGLTLLYFDKTIKHITYDTYGEPNASNKFRDKLLETISDNSFIGIYVNDEGSTQLGNNRKILREVGLIKLAELGYRQPYIAIKTESGHILEFSGKTGTTINTSIIVTKKLLSTPIKLFKYNEIKNSRGMQLLTLDAGNITIQQFDTYINETDAKNFINALSLALQNDTFLLMYSHDEASHLLKQYSNILIESGLPILADLQYHEAYIAYKSNKGIVEIRGNKSTELKKTLFFNKNIGNTFDIEDIITSRPNYTYFDIISLSGPGGVTSYFTTSKPHIEKSIFWRSKYIPESSNLSDYLIAHAGGGIDGNTYTNSKEAVLNSIKKGYKFIEIDMNITTDGYIVGVHDPIDQDLETFMSRKVFGKYSPLSYKEINEFMTTYEDIILVTDKIWDFNKLKEQIFYPERMIVEVFSVANYIKAKAVGFKYVALCIWQSPEIEFLFDKNIDIITTSTAFLDQYPEKAQRLHNADITILTFTENSKEKFNSNLGSIVSLYYTDFGLE